MIFSCPTLHNSTAQKDFKSLNFISTAQKDFKSLNFMRLVAFNLTFPGSEPQTLSEAPI